MSYGVRSIALLLLAVSFLACSKSKPLNITKKSQPSSQTEPAPVKKQIVSEYDPSWKIAATADFDGNGEKDLLWRHDTLSAVVIWLMKDGVVIKKQQVAEVPHVWTVIGAGDIDGDKRADIIWRNQTGLVYLWLLDGSGKIIDQGGLGIPDIALWQTRGVGDFNSDGKVDILWESSDGDVAVWLLDGKNQIDGKKVIGGAGLDWEVIGSGDFNGDGNSDIFFRNKTTDQFAFWLIDSSATLKEAQFLDGSGSEWDVLIGDANGDKISDLIFHHKTLPNLVVWEIEFTAGLLRLRNADVVEMVAHPSYIAAVLDLNGDKKADLVFRNPNQLDLQTLHLDGSSSPLRSMSQIMEYE